MVQIVPLGKVQILFAKKSGQDRIWLVLFQNLTQIPMTTFEVLSVSLIWSLRFGLKELSKSDLILRGFLMLKLFKMAAQGFVLANHHNFSLGGGDLILESRKQDTKAIELMRTYLWGFEPRSSLRQHSWTGQGNSLPKAIVPEGKVTVYAQVHSERPLGINLNNAEMVLRKVLLLVEFLPSEEALMKAGHFQLLLPHPQQVSLFQSRAILEEGFEDSPRLRQEGSGGAASPSLTVILAVVGRREHVADLSLQQHIQSIREGLVSLQVVQVATRDVFMQIQEILSKFAAKQFPQLLVLPHGSITLEGVDEVVHLRVLAFGYASLQLHYFHYSISPQFREYWGQKQKVNAYANLAPRGQRERFDSRETYQPIQGMQT